MKIIKDPVAIDDFRQMALGMFGNMVKAVVDIEQEIMVVDGELHSDEEALLLENGSKQKNLWGINIYPEIGGDDWLEFDSMINVRPSQNNRTRGVDNPEIQQKVIKIVNRLVIR
ncbi:MAG: DUF5674 family protein [bacterium]|nr:DUF5674 family protein [bacterium]